MEALSHFGYFDSEFCGVGAFAKLLGGRRRKPLSSEQNGIMVGKRTLCRLRRLLTRIRFEGSGTRVTGAGDLAGPTKLRISWMKLAVGDCYCATVGPNPINPLSLK